jgi:hypothetical protein
MRFSRTFRENGRNFQRERELTALESSGNATAVSRSYKMRENLI